MIGDSLSPRPTLAPFAAGPQRRHRHVLLAAVVCLSCVGTLVAHVGDANSDQAPAAAGAFGFDIGDERRYAIGPPGALQPGEGELWIIRLESISGEPPNRRMNFLLEHEATRYQTTPNVFSRGQLMVFRGSMELTVNEHGFPLHVQYRGDFDNAPSQHSREEVTLTYAEGEFAVHNRFSMRFRQYDLDVPSSPLVDPTIPRGVYLSGGENPALYSLILVGAGIQEVGDIEYMSLTTSRFASRGTRGTGGATWERSSSSTRGVDGFTWEPPSSRSRDGNSPTQGRSLSRRRLRFEEFTTVDIGGVEEEALLLRRESGSRPDIYVRPDGTVLRVDISTRLKHTAFIRLLRPTEY